MTDFCQDSGKLIYATRRSAENAMKRTSGRKPMTGAGGRLAAYECPRCSGWHYGHAPRWAFTPHRVARCEGVRP